MPTPPPFEEIFRANSERVYHFCLAQMRNVADAEDLAAEVFEAAYTAYQRTAPDPATAHLWLFRIARNRASNRRRHIAVVARVLPRFAGGARQHDVAAEETAVVSAQLAAVLAALATLGHRDRQLVGMRLGAGLGYAEIATVAGMSERAAVVATGRALTRLRARLADGGWMDDADATTASVDGGRRGQ